MPGAVFNLLRLPLSTDAGGASNRLGVLHPPAITGIAICLLCVLLFAIVAREALQNGGRNTFDDGWASDMQKCSGDRPWLRDLMAFMTHLGGVPFLGGVAAIGTFYQWRRGRNELAVAWLCIALGGGLLNYALKEIFNRPRPPEEMRDRAVHETNESFPSGHAMGSTIGYGLLGYMATMKRRPRRRTLLILGGLFLLVPVIGFSRIYLRAHWFTDVVGGLLIGSAWLALCVGLFENWRWERELQRPLPLSGVPLDKT